MVLNGFGDYESHMSCKTLFTVDVTIQKNIMKAKSNIKKEKTDGQLI